MLTSLPLLLDQSHLTDVTLSAEGRTIRAHRVVLSACSSFFSDLFRTMEPPFHPVVVIPGASFGAIVALLTFMYSGEVNVFQDQIPMLLSLAETLGIKGLADFSGVSIQHFPFSFNPIESFVGCFFCCYHFLFLSYILFALYSGLFCSDQFQSTVAIYEDFCSWLTFIVAIEAILRFSKPIKFIHNFYSFFIVLFLLLFLFFFLCYCSLFASCLCCSICLSHLQNVPRHQPTNCETPPVVPKEYDVHMRESSLTPSPPTPQHIQIQQQQQTSPTSPIKFPHPFENIFGKAFQFCPSMITNPLSFSPSAINRSAELFARFQQQQQRQNQQQQMEKTINDIEHATQANIDENGNTKSFQNNETKGSVGGRKSKVSTADVRKIDKIAENLRSTSVMCSSSNISTQNSGNSEQKTISPFVDNQDQMVKQMLPSSSSSPTSNQAAAAAAAAATMAAALMKSTPSPSSQFGIISEFTERNNVRVKKAEIFLRALIRSLLQYD